MCRKLKSVLCAFLLVFCVAMPCSAAEITDQELTQLETNLNQQQSETIETIEQTGSNLEDAEREAGNIIADSKRLIENIRKRNEN